MRIRKERANKILFKHNISPYKIQPERPIKEDRGRTGRNSPRTPYPPRLPLGSGKEKAYEKIRKYIYGFSVLSNDYKVRIELFFKYLKIRLWIFSKKSSNFSQKAQPECINKTSMSGSSGWLFTKFRGNRMSHIIMLCQIKYLVSLLL